MKALFGLLLTGLLTFSTASIAQNKGELVVFIQDGRSISQNFKRSSLNDIKKIAKSNDLKMKIVDASKGAPIEVSYTPAIFYKKGEKNILFKGRYNDLENIESFVESNGSEQPKVYEQPATSPLTWQVGRATMKTTVKIHPLSGKPPRAKKFNEQEFQAEAMASLIKGMASFHPSGNQNFDARDYHMEFFPEVHRREGVLLVQMKLYSSFDHKTPVVVTEVPSGAEWKKWEEAFEKAGNRLERALIAQIGNGLSQPFVNIGLTAMGWIAPPGINSLKYKIGTMHHCVLA